MPKTYDYDWQALLTDQQASGLSMIQYCKEKGLPYHAFKNNKYEIQKKQKQFVPVKQEVSKVMNLVLNGNRISLDPEMDDISMSRILKALTQ